jgi:hypothetical protein
MPQGTIGDAGMAAVAPAAIGTAKTRPEDFLKFP